MFEGLMFTAGFLAGVIAAATFARKNDEVSETIIEGSVMPEVALPDESQA